MRWRLRLLNYKGQPVSDWAELIGTVSYGGGAAAIVALSGGDGRTRAVVWPILHGNVEVEEVAG